MTDRLVLAALFCIGVCAAPAQNIRKHYVAKAETDGTIYHTLPATLFEHPEAGDLTYDITYKTGGTGRATICFTCSLAQPVPADSVRFVAGRTVLAGPVGKIYLLPEKRRWKHRYAFETDASLLCGFFDERTEPRVELYVGERPCVFRAKRSAWRHYAPIGYRIFEMIRVNE